MFKLGEIQELEILRITGSGAFLNEEAHEGDYDDDILLPGGELLEEHEEGNRIEVFIYKDSEDRFVATINKPMLILGEIALLKVVDVNNIGAFLDWGLMKDLLLPYKEQTARVKVGDACLVALYIDNTERLCATMDLSQYLILDEEDNFKVGDKVSFTVYKIVKNTGAFVAIEDKYIGFIPWHEVNPEMRPGHKLMGRVSRKLKDGKIDLSLKENMKLRMEHDSDKIFKLLVKEDGFLPFNDKSKPEDIKKKFNMSKQSFKKAIGKLLKEKKIEIGKDGIRQKN